MKPIVTEENAAGLKPIDIGDTLPTLVLRNEKDEEFDVSSAVKTKGAIIFLVPKVNTGELVVFNLSVSPYPRLDPVRNFTAPYPPCHIHIHIPKPAGP